MDAIYETKNNNGQTVTFAINRSYHCRLCQIQDTLEKQAIWNASQGDSTFYCARSEREGLRELYRNEQ